MLLVVMNFGFAYAGLSTTDTTYLHYHKTKSKQSILKNGLSFALPPLKPGVVSTTKINVPHADDKLLQDVDVVSTNDQLNFKFTLARNSNVTIKIMDVLGNDVLNVVQERFETGEQKFSISNKLSRGFYFARINAGTESVIKRISIY